MQRLAVSLATLKRERCNVSGYPRRPPRTFLLAICPAGPAVVAPREFFDARLADAIVHSGTADCRSVSDLERRLGARLLHRTTRKLSLTAEGKVFLAQCREVLASIDESEAEISNRSRTASGELKVSVPVSFGIQHLAPLWSEFVRAHPRVSLDVQLADRILDLVDEGYDLAVRIARLPDSSLVSRRLSPTPTRPVLCASPQYLQTRGTPQHPHDLADHDVTGYSLFAMNDQWQFTGPEGPMTVQTDILRSRSPAEPA